MHASFNEKSLTDTMTSLFTNETIYVKTAFTLTELIMIRKIRGRIFIR
jgi:hypothetical protein